MEKPKSKLEIGESVQFDGHTCRVIDENTDGTVDLYDVEHATTWPNIPQSAILHFAAAREENTNETTSEEESDNINPINLSAYNEDPRMKSFSKQKEIQHFIEFESLQVREAMLKINEQAKREDVAFLDPESLN